MGSILIQSMSINMATVTELYLTEIYLYGKAKHILFSYHLFVFRAICTFGSSDAENILAIQPKPLLACKYISAGRAVIQRCGPQRY